jgi:CheY-like chemotaxis protein
VVDDDEESRRILTHLLEGIGAEVDPADSGHDALASLADTAPDVVFLDLRMPDMDGFDTLKQIRARPELDGVRVLAVSASVFEFERQGAVEAGFDAFIRKPFRFEEIYGTLAELLGVEYVYAEAASEEPAPRGDWSDIELPAETLARLREAASYRQVTQLESCFRELDGLSPDAAKLATHLRELRRQHRMEDMLAVLEGVGHG